MRRPRVLVAITLAEVGGAQTYVANLLPGLVQDYDVVVAAHGPGPLKDAAETAGARFVPLHHVRRAINPWRDLLGLLELIRLCRRVRPDILHANSSKAGLLGCLAAYVARVPVRVFTVHGWAFLSFSGLAARFYLWSARLTRRFATRVICVAEQGRAAGTAARACDPERTLVIRGAVDVGAAPHARPAHNVARIVTVGRLKPPKDFVTLVGALAELDRGSFRALVIGEGPSRPMIASEIRRLDLDEAVTLLGERDDVPACLADADIFALSSTSEGLPISVMEAMAAGLPVVAAAVGGVPELVADGETGILVPPRDVTSFAGALRRLVEDRELRERLGAAARSRAEAGFDLARFRGQHLALYRSLLEEGGLPVPAE